MRGIQEFFFFGWAGWDGTLCNFQPDENIALLQLRERKKLIYMNSQRYFVVYCLNTSKAIPIKKKLRKKRTNIYKKYLNWRPITLAV